MIAATAALEWVWKHWRVIATGAGFAVLVAVVNADAEGRR